MRAAVVRAAAAMVRAAVGRAAVRAAVATVRAAVVRAAVRAAVAKAGGDGGEGHGEGCGGDG